MDFQPGVAQFMEEALESGAHLVLLTSTCSSPREALVESALASLGPSVSERVRVFQCPQPGAADAEPADEIASLEKSLHKAAAKVPILHIDWGFAACSCDSGHEGPSCGLDKSNKIL